MLLLGDIPRRHARTRGDRTAYVIGGARVTYLALHERSNQLARALQRLGVGRGDRVAVMANNRAEYPVIYFAALKLGAIVVPINARFTAAEAEAVLRHSEAQTICVALEFSELIATLRSEGRIPSLRHFIRIDDGDAGDARLADLAEAEVPDDVEAQVDELDPHVMLYTSGTTGSPKGTLLSHRSYFLQATTSHLQLGVNEDDVALSMFPMFHMGGWALPLGFWHTGASVVIMPKADPLAMLQAIAKERITYLYAVPTLYASMLAVPQFDTFDLSSLRLVASGTAAMTTEQVHRIRDRFGCRNMFIVYGSTEAGPVSVLRPPDVSNKPETVGHPYLDVEIRLLDADGYEVPVGGVGEIAVRSEFAMQGYWRNPEETARTIRNGWVLTGDLGSFDADGFLSIVGRRKEVIRSAGESIFPVEIERVLLTHPAIRDASVLGVPDSHWGEAVVAAVVLRAGATLAAADVIDHVRAHLASYKKPRHVCFLAELPRTASSQQVQKPLLRELLLERITQANRRE